MRALPSRLTVANVTSCLALSLILSVACLPAEAGAKPIKSKITATIFGVITNDATIKYAITGQVAAQGFTFGCMEDRQVTLIKVGPNKKPKRVVGTESGFFGKYTVVIEKRLSAIPGYYYAKVKPRIRNSKKGRLRCLSARTPTFLVEVPDQLLTLPFSP
jgi:hypothetical protein